MNKTIIRRIESLLRFIPDKMYLQIKYRYKMGKSLDWNNLVTYTEMLQWLKLHDRDEKYTTLVDKYEVKKFVASIIGEEYVIPTIGIWEDFDEIDFELLPEQFVLKCTHDSGGIVICDDKKKFDKKEAKKIISASLKNNFFWSGREWPYKNVKARILAEPYMTDTVYGELRDYKFFVFDGIPKLLFVATDRSNREKETAFDFFDMDYNHLDIRNGHPNAEKFPDKPMKFDEMKQVAAKLAQGLKHVRVDLYEVDGKVYFGEMTFYHHSGFAKFEPEKWDYILGEWIS